MKYAKIENNIVEQIQPYFEEGFIEVTGNVEAGMEKKLNNTFDYPQSYYDAIQARLAEKQAKEIAKASALAKLSALGLTEEEVQAIIK
jgi:hypothetical protein